MKFKLFIIIIGESLAITMTSPMPKPNQLKY